MMRIRIVGVRVRHCFMTVRMRMCDPGADGRRVPVPVMIVMRVFMLMCERRVNVRVFMAFSDVQPHAEPHQRAGDQQLSRRKAASRRRRIS